MPKESKKSSTLTRASLEFVAQLNHSRTQLYDFRSSFPPMGLFVKRRCNTGDASFKSNLDIMMLFPKAFRYGLMLYKGCIRSIFNSILHSAKDGYSSCRRLVSVKPSLLEEQSQYKCSDRAGKRKPYVITW